MPRRPNLSRQTRTLLATLSAEPRAWRHGYELSTLTGLKSGTLYPLLIRLNDQGLLNSEWRPVEHPGRPPRHMYQLTLSGLALARSQAAQSAPAPLIGAPLAKPT